MVPARSAYSTAVAGGPAVAQIKSGIPPVCCHASGVSLSRTQIICDRPPDTDKNSIL